jgi:small subunit ribosomal protein S17e
VKKVARELVKRYPEQFSLDFEGNKKFLGTVAIIYSSKLRNRIAGYITRLVAISKAREAEATEEATGEGTEEEKE